MKEYVVVYKLRHEKNTEEGNKEMHVLYVEANTFAEAELTIKVKWAKVNCDAEIMQISIFA